MELLHSLFSIDAGSTIEAIPIEAIHGRDPKVSLPPGLGIDPMALTAPPFAVACVSVISSIWLLRATSRNRCSSSQTLRLCQLWHLACANLLSYFASIFLTIAVNFGFHNFLARSTHMASTIRLLCFLAVSWGPKASLLLECHLCWGIFSMLCLSDGQPLIRVRSDFLYATVNSLWILSLLLAFLQPSLGRLDVETTMKKPMADRMLNGVYTVEVYEIAPAVALCFLCFVASCCKAFRLRVDDPVGRLAWTRIRWYPAVVLATYLPVCLWKLNAIREGKEKCKHCFPELVAVTMGMLNGSLNAIVYVFDNRLFENLEREALERRRAMVQSAQEQHRQEMERLQREREAGQAQKAHSFPSPSPRKSVRFSFVQTEDGPSIEACSFTGCPLSRQMTPGPLGAGVGFSSNLVANGQLVGTGSFTLPPVPRQVTPASPSLGGTSEESA